LRRCTIKRLPNVLFIDLKRFEFNFDTMSKFKINDYCEFPTQLDMNKYTTEFIKRQDLIREMDEKNITYDELDEDRKAIFNK
jgi:ubiquitin carboxyl-terminal hydrolase 9/24